LNFRRNGTGSNKAMGQEATKLFKGATQKISFKTAQRYSDIISFIRRRL
jgi:hypothetical protein